MNAQSDEPCKMFHQLMARMARLPLCASARSVTPFPWTDLAIIIALVVLNGVFAMSELAIVSAKTSALEAKAEAGSSAARIAIGLAANPGKFLSTVQIGITLIGIINGAYSGASLGGPVGERLAALGLPAEYADDFGFAVVIAFTTYISLIIGELVPKQLALQIAVPVSLVMARPMAFMAKAAAPFVWLLDSSSAAIIRLMGLSGGSEDTVTAQELQMIFAEATRSGVIEDEQRQLLTGVVRLAERPVREMMTPRMEIDWIEADADAEKIRETIERSSHSLLPVAEGSPDTILGVVKVRDVLAALVAGRPAPLIELFSRSARAAAVCSRRLRG